MGEADRRTSFLRGTADLCLLVAVDERPGHAYELATRLVDAGLGPLSYGTVYPLLARLRALGLLTEQSRPSSRGPARKVYALTASGQVALGQWAAQWRDLHASVAAYLDRHVDQHPGPGHPLDRTPGPPDAADPGDDDPSAAGRSGHAMHPGASSDDGEDSHVSGTVHDDEVPVAVRQVLRRIDRRLWALGVPATARAQVRADVGADLQAARLDGIPPHEVVEDPIAFADEVATSLGVDVPTGPQPMYARLLTSGAAAVVVAVGAAYLVFLPGLYWLTDHTPAGVADSGALPIAVYVVYGMFFTATVLLGVRFGLAAAQRVRQTVVRAAVLLPASAALSLPAAVLLARSTGFNASLPVIAVEALIIVGCAAAALLAARRWALTTA